MIFKVILFLLMFISCQQEQVAPPSFQPLQRKEKSKPIKDDFMNFDKKESMDMAPDESCGSGEEEIDMENFDPMKPAKKNHGCSVQ